MHLQRLVFILGALLISGCANLKKNEAYKPSTAPEEQEEPRLTKPKVKSYVVPDTIEGNKYIKAHRVYILEDPGSWSR